MYINIHFLDRKMMSVPQSNTQQGVGPSLMNIEVMQNSKLFRAECARLIQETDKACKRMQDHDNKQLGKKGDNRKKNHSRFCTTVSLTLL